MAGRTPSAGAQLEQARKERIPTSMFPPDVPRQRESFSRLKKAGYPLLNECGPICGNVDSIDMCHRGVGPLGSTRLFDSPVCGSAQSRARCRFYWKSLVSGSLPHADQGVATVISCRGYWSPAVVLSLIDFARRWRKIVNCGMRSSRSCCSSWRRITRQTAASGSLRAVSASGCWLSRPIRRVCCRCRRVTMPMVLTLLGCWRRRSVCGA